MKISLSRNPTFHFQRQANEKYKDCILHGGNVQTFDAENISVQSSHLKSKYMQAKFAKFTIL